jgi:starch phosphorylase
MLTPEFMGRIVFLDDYDMQLARWLVSGVDIWLNNPIAPLEASGTSGMKAAANGRLNLSVLDGWWAEAWNGENGWGIPPVTVQDPNRRDALEAELILDTIEEEVLPLYYGRRSEDRRKINGSPGSDYSPEWVRRSKRAMSTVIPAFNTRRMVFDYLRGVYQPAARHYLKLASREFAGARLLADWKQRVRQAWAKVSLRILSEPPPDMPRGERLRLRVAVDLNGLAPSDVYVEFVARRILPESKFTPPALCSYDDAPRAGLWNAMLKATGEQEADGAAVFALDAQPLQCGQFATEIRIFPWHELLSHPYELGLMKRL